MKLAALLEEHNILVHMDWRGLDEAIEALLETFGPRLGRLDGAKIRERLLEVESELPRPLGHGVHIPHTRLAGLEQTLVAVGTCEQGLVRRPDDDELVHLVFLVLTPKTQAAGMLQTMAAIARLVQIQENRKALVSTTSAARLLRILEESGIEVKKAVVAADLMNPAPVVLRPDMMLRQAVAALGANREEALPVVDEASGELLGEVSARMVLQVGLPKYMKLVTDPQILSDFEPFEAFYRREDELPVEDVMGGDIVRLAPETPIEIVAHEMLSQHRGRAYVVRDAKLLGVVTRTDIVRKVLTL